MDVKTEAAGRESEEQNVVQGGEDGQVQQVNTYTVTPGPVKHIDL